MKIRNLDYKSIKCIKQIKKSNLAEQKKINYLKPDSSDYKLFYILPKIDKNSVKKAFSKPNSLLIRYLNNRTHFIIKQTKEDLKRPIKVIPGLNFRNLKNKKYNSLSKENSKSRNCFSEREDVKQLFPSKLNKNYSTTTYITEAGIKNDLEKIEEKEKDDNTTMINQKNITDTDSNTSSLKSKRITDKNPNIKDDKINSTININCLSYYLTNPKIVYPNSIKINQIMSLDKCKNLNKFFRRIRSYQPQICSNWKGREGITLSESGRNHSVYKNDIHYQSNVFLDQTKLIEDDILYYKTQIVNMKNYTESFKALSLRNKIKYNKSLEETIGILILLPQLILLDFYKFIEKFDNINIPDNSKFVDKYIFDEVDNLYYNNTLISECLEFFKGCFDVYLILLKEVDDMSLKPRNFNNVMSGFEKARYNINYVVNASKNAIEVFKNEIKILNKFNKNMGIPDFSKIEFSSTKINFPFKKDEERQKRLRIDACLNFRKFDEMDNDLKLGKSKSFRSRNFKSIINSNLITSLLKHCNKEKRNLITTQRINTEIDGDSRDEEKFGKTQRMHKVIKLNY